MMDQFIVVIEPGARSVQTYERIKQLARDIGVNRVRVVANKVRDERDEAFIRTRIPQRICWASSTITPMSLRRTETASPPMTTARRPWRRSGPSRQEWMPNNKETFAESNRKE